MRIVGFGQTKSKQIGHVEEKYVPHGDYSDYSFCKIKRSFVSANHINRILV